MGQFVTNFKQGVAYIWANTGLRTVVVFALVLNFMANPLFSVVFPYFAKEVLLMEASHYGVTQSSFPVGLMLGTLLVGMLSQKMRQTSPVLLGYYWAGSAGTADEPCCLSQDLPGFIAHGDNG